MICVCRDVEEHVKRMKCWKCGGRNILAEKPVYVDGEPVDIYGCVLLDSNDDFVIPVKVWCVDCGIWWTVTFTYDHRTLQLKDVF